MNRLLLILFLSLAAGASAIAQTSDDEYVRVFHLIQNAETLERSGQAGLARTAYLEAQTTLQSFQKIHPDWNPRVVNYRLEYIAAKMAALPAGATPAVPKAAPASPVVSPATPPDATTEQQRQIGALQEDLRRLQGDKSLLEAKLKEALSAQPAAVDPQELARVQAQLKELLKENELLKTTPVDPARPATSDRKALEEARKALATQTEQTRNLAAERDSLQERLKSLTSSPAAADAMRVENELLKRRLADASAIAARETETSRKLSQAETRIAALQSDAEQMRLEKIALENRVKTLGAQSTATPVAAAAPADLARIKLLEAERNDLARQLSAANKDLSTRKGRAAAAQMEQLNAQLAALRARVEVFEARAVPYTAEELALFQQPAARLAGNQTKAEKKSIRELPSGVTALVASAQRHFAAQEFDQAEKDYLEILRRDENNAYTLANLAAIQLERGNLAGAETNVTKAVAGAPNDAYALSILGQLKFRQGKYDEALDAQSRAAKLNPNSAEIQNHLGVALGHKGLRGPAETALRRALQLEPGYAAAHSNLAVIYLSQQPPSVELARWHYKKALAAGGARIPELEKALDQKAAGAP